MRLYYLVALIVILLDQFTKWLIVKYMELHDSIPIIENFFAITSHRNKGAAWGILQGQMTFFYIVTAIVVVGIIYYIEKHVREHKFMTISLCVILGGAIGNFIDRLFRKEVVDFLDFTIFSYEFPIFNVADMALTIGVGLFLFATLLEERKTRNENNV